MVNIVLSPRTFVTLDAVERGLSIAGSSERLIKQHGVFRRE